MAGTGKATASVVTFTMVTCVSSAGLCEAAVPCYHQVIYSGITLPVTALWGEVSLKVTNNIFYCFLVHQKISLQV